MVDDVHTPIQSPRAMPNEPPPPPRKPTATERYRAARRVELEKILGPNAPIPQINIIVEEEINEIRNHHQFPDLMLNQFADEILKN